MKECFYRVDVEPLLVKLPVKLEENVEGRCSMFAFVIVFIEQRICGRIAPNQLRTRVLCIGQVVDQ
jgi:hypothetical protein